MIDNDTIKVVEKIIHILPLLSFLFGLLTFAIEDIISAANIPADQKKGLISKLRELPADAIKHLILQLLTQGVQNLPVALQLIEKALKAS